MKPSWSDAPEWAKYLAMDQDCWWWWYENEPLLEIHDWRNIGKTAIASEPDVLAWRDTLEPRPLDTST